MFAVGPMGGLMPEWPGEGGENPTLTRNRDHAGVVWEAGYQITGGWGGVPSRVTGRRSMAMRRRRGAGLMVAAVVTGTVGGACPGSSSGWAETRRLRCPGR